jgi:hypothetical protein
VERLYTLREALAYLKFPSSEALRKYLDRRPGLVQARHWCIGRRTKRVLAESDLEVLQEILSRVKLPGQ